MVVVKLGYMLESLSILRYDLNRENPLGADNQQERPCLHGILNDYTPGIHMNDDIVWTAWRHAEGSRNDYPFASAKVTNRLSLEKAWPLSQLPAALLGNLQVNN